MSLDTDLGNTNTKIIATYGPAVMDEDKLTGIIAAGADVIRLNFSHGEYDSHRAAVQQIRTIAARLDAGVAILQDLRGPKIRLGILEPDVFSLQDDATVYVYTGDTTGTPDHLPVNGYDTLAEDVKPGEAILLNDGTVRLKVVGVNAKNEIECKVINGGEIASRKGVNLPETDLKTLETITDKDWADLAFGCELDVDFIALSFVRNAEDVNKLKAKILKHGKEIPVIAKIEKREALVNLDMIIAAADGIMVARGDLGVETDLEEVALHQKDIIRACNQQGKVVVTATQMLETMVHAPVPTRAEVSDISNAIFDGTDAIMLSAETATGKYPLETVRIMDRIARRTEQGLDPNRMLAKNPFMQDIGDAVAHAACVTANEIGAKALVCLTRSGLTAQLVSRYRPSCPVFAISPSENTVRQMSIVWGVMALQVEPGMVEEKLILRSMELIQETGMIKKGDRVVITAGVSHGDLRGQTNLVRVEII